MPRLSTLLELIRPHNCAVGILMAGLGAYLTGPSAHWLSLRTGYAALAMGVSVAIANVVNDYRDSDVDRLNKPQRPIPSGRISLPGTAQLIGLLAIGGLGVAAPLGPGLAGLALIITGLGVGYSYFWKNTVLLGNAYTALVSGTPLLFGGLAAGRLTPSLLITDLIIVLFIFAREILKTIADREGDARAGLHTVATQWGNTIALRLVWLLLAGFVGATWLPWGLGLATPQYLYATLPCILAPTLFIAVRLRPNGAEARLQQALWVMKFLMFSSALPIVLLK